jgi:hypothetical protein
MKTPFGSHSQLVSQLSELCHLFKFHHTHTHWEQELASLLEMKHVPVALLSAARARLLALLMLKGELSVKLRFMKVCYTTSILLPKTTWHK